MQYRYHCWVTGRVQGVSYRASTQQQAQTLGLTGWVKNLADGRVEWVAEGDETALQQLLKWAYLGPRYAQVEQIELNQTIATNEFQAFEIR